MRNGRLVFAGLLLAAGGCDSPPAAPAKPTWVDDVEPILHGNCFHCHGAAQVDPLATAQRWDFFDIKDPKLLAIRDVSMDFKGPWKWDSAKDHALSWPAYVALKNDMRMPPAPATPLSDRDVQVLKTWSTMKVRGTRTNNNKPTAAWLARPSTIVVSDADHEQVLGKVSCGGADAPVLSSGTTTLPQGWMPPCTATLFDGQDVVTVNLP
jgi:hypothetical protein